MGIKIAKMAKSIISTRSFKMSRVLFWVAMFTALCLLLMFEKVSEVVSETLSKVGVDVPSPPMLRQYAANGFLAGCGVLLLIVSVLIVVPLAKFAVIGAGLALAGYGIYQLYKMITGGSFQDLTPKK